MSRAIYWFTNDLRLHDNRSLNNALAKESQLSFIYCVDPRWFQPNRYGQRSMGSTRYRFLHQSLQSLNTALKAHGQHLLCFFEAPEVVISRLHQAHGVNRVYRSINAGFYEQAIREKLCARHENLSIIETHTHTVFPQSALPFSLSALPKTFSAFRRKVESLLDTIDLPQPAPTAYGAPALPTLTWQKVPPKTIHTQKDSEKEAEKASQKRTQPQSSTVSTVLFPGGASAGQAHLARYFRGKHASTYKMTRNALDDFATSTKFSPWLAQGCLSPREILFALTEYEFLHGADENTYWIAFELLWREYFQWYAHAHGATLFSLRGIAQDKPLTSFYGERYQRWCQGNTPYPIINACMRQLNETGYLSNRGRQLVASCFVNELNLDWRYGAAYFEEKLIDYDVASNWGNWQYLAGVGADPRGKRWFNLEKQTDTYDPERAFIRKWAGDDADQQPLDSVDAVGWPIEPSTDAETKPDSIASTSPATSPSVITTAVDPGVTE